MLDHFIHLRNASPYSLARGMLRLKELVQATKMMGMPALALTDRDNFFGAMEFSQLAVDAGIQPIIGCDAAVGMKTADGMISGRVALLCQSQAGYRHLIAVMSKAYAHLAAGDELILPLDDFAGSEGIIVLSGGREGCLMPFIARGREKLAMIFLEKLATVFPDRCYIELQRHHNEVLEEATELAAEPMLIDWAIKKSLPLVATNDNHFMTTQLVMAQAALMCISAQKKMNDSDHPQLTAEHYFKPPAVMQKLFADLPEAIAQTAAIARRCYFLLEKTKPIIPVYHPDNADDPAIKGKTADQLLQMMASESLAKRLATKKLIPKQAGDDKAGNGASNGIGDGAVNGMANGAYNKSDDNDSSADEKRYDDRLAYELSVIKTAGFSDYFLIVADFISYARRQGIPVGPGRGSATGSLVAYCLGITNLDPIHYGLFFERFLNPGRLEMPDVDIDFCQERRDEVLDYVKQKYGSDHVAQIITFGSLQARAAVRDVGRVLGYPYSKIDDIAKLIPNRLVAASEGAEETDEEKEKRARKLPLALAQAPDLKNLYDNDDVARHVIDTAQLVEGLYRNVSTHAAGVVMAGKPLHEIVPLYRDPRAANNVLMTQFSMKSAEMAGLLKFDFLGLRTLSIMDSCIKTLQQRRGITIDLDQLPLDDKKTFDLLCSSSTVGIFQFESEGITDLLYRMQPDKLEHLISAVALYRPGPMEIIPNYLARRAGREAIRYDHASLQQVLAETYGLPIYQEQVIEMARVFAGFTAEKADVFRKAMGKKDKEKMAVMRKEFIAGAQAKHQVSEALALKIFNMVAAFADYGFNKSHSAAYGLVAYQTAYLKAHYPYEFLAANMRFDMHDTDRLAILVNEAKQLDIKILPPDILTSDIYFDVVYEQGAPIAIRYGMAALKNVGVKAVEAFVNARSGQVLKDISDVFAIAPPGAFNKRMIESLAAAGAFDSLHENRREVFENIPLLLKILAANERATEAGATSLFGDDEDFNKNINSPLQSFDPWSEKELGEKELESFGFYFLHHPLGGFENLAKEYQLTPLASLKQLTGGKVNCLAVINEVRSRNTKAGKEFFVLYLADSSGEIEINFFDLTNKTRAIIVPGEKIFIEVQITKDKTDQNRHYRNIRKIIKASDMMDGKGEKAGFSKQPHGVVRDTAVEKALYKALLVRVQRNKGVEGAEREPLMRLKNILSTRAAGEGRVKVEMDLMGARVVIDLGLLLHIDAEIAKELQHVGGVEFFLEH